jgi:hypothetical protein
MSSAASDASTECLFAQLVARRLRSLSQPLLMDSPYFGSGSDMYGSGYESLEYPFPLPSSCDCGSRLTSLETSVAAIALDMKAIKDFVAQLPVLSAVHAAGVSGSSPNSPVRPPPAQASNVQSPVSSSIHKFRRLRDSPRSPPTSSDPSPAVSPSQHQFQCPLCLKHQQTPKSHCEHLKNAVGDGVRMCRFDSDHSRHERIVRLFGSGEVFVQWYYMCLWSLLANDLC